MAVTGISPGPGLNQETVTLRSEFSDEGQQAFFRIQADFALGDHGLQARATDTNGVSRVSPTITIHIRPANDDFADRILIIGNSALLHANGINGTLESGEPAHGPVNWESVWWSWTAPESGRVTLSKPTALNLRYVLLDVYTGSALTNLVLATNTPANGSGTLVTTIAFDVQAGTNYQIAIAGSFFDQSDVPITFTFAPSSTGLATGTTASMPVLSQPERQSSTQFSFILTGTPGSNYTILTTTNLTLPISDWVTLMVTNLSSTFAIVRHNEATNVRSFYRVKSGP